MPDIGFRITREVSPKELVEIIEPAMQRLGNAIAARAQRLAPTRTYALHDSINTETTVENGKVRTIVGAGGGDVNYAIFVEQGTSHQAAQPYLKPAMLQTRASDLGFTGAPSQHGVVQILSKRARRAQAAAKRRAYRQTDAYKARQAERKANRAYEKQVKAEEDAGES